MTATLSPPPGPPLLDADAFDRALRGPIDSPARVYYAAGLILGVMKQQAVMTPVTTVRRLLAGAVPRALFDHAALLLVHTGRLAGRESPFGGNDLRDPEAIDDPRTGKVVRVLTLP